MIALHSQNIQTVDADDLLKWCREFTRHPDVGIMATRHNAFTRGLDKEFVQIVDNDYRMTKDALINSFEDIYGNLYVTPDAIIAAALEQGVIAEIDKYVVILAESDLFDTDEMS